jgi:hypothetical protein
VGTRELLLHESEAMPEPLLQEVLDFLRFLRATRLPGAEANAPIGESDDALGRLDLSRTALTQGWDGPEEDEAWKDL